MYPPVSKCILYDINKLIRGQNCTSEAYTSNNYCRRNGFLLKDMQTNVLKELAIIDKYMYTK